MSLPPLTLPPELWDGVLDHLHNDFASLRSTALVCHTWVPTSRLHLFAAITLSDKCPARAASLNSLLANPHATIPPAVQALVLHGAHTLVQLRGIQVPSPAITDFTTLLSLAPRLIHFRYLRELSLSDVPRTFLSAVPTVERVTLTGTCIGVGLLWVVRDLPRLTHLTLENVSALPCRRGRSAEIQSSVHTVIIRSSSFLCASLIVLGWLGCAAPNVAILSVDMFYARELQYLAEYLSVISSTLRELELSISGADIGAS